MMDTRGPKWLYKMHVISNAKNGFHDFWISTFFLMVEKWTVLTPIRKNGKLGDQVWFVILSLFIL